MPKKPVAYIDADIILHRAVSFVDREFDGEPMADWKTALHYFDWILDSWLEQAGPLEDYFLVLSVGPNFRKDLYPDYKANRKDIEPHPAFKDLKNEVMEMQGSVWEEGIEADDLIGIRCSEDPKGTLAISADKDFATVPCNLMIPRSHGRDHADWHHFTEAEADMNWLIQAMTGDTIDNYKGIPGVGPKKAEKIIPKPAPLEVMWGQVRQAFIDKGMTEQDALTMVRLARILRDGDYDFDTKKVNLWEPPKTTSPDRATTQDGSSNQSNSSCETALSSGEET
jgi:5'-3' exonuclease